jgi:preprotein translocase subunit SecD
MRFLATDKAAHPEVAVAGNEIVAQLPGFKSPPPWLGEMGMLGELYFRPVLCYAPPYRPEEGGATRSTPSDGYVTPPRCAGSYTSPQSNFPNNAPDPSLAVYKSASASDGTDDPSKVVILPSTSAGPNRLELGPAVDTAAGLATGAIITSAYAQYWQPAGWTIQFTFSSRGNRIFNDLASRYYRRWVGDDLDGVVITYPQLESRVFPGSGQITGSFTASQAQLIAHEPMYGALPVALRLRTVGTMTSSTRTDSTPIRVALIAGLVLLLILMVAGLFWYRSSQDHYGAPEGPASLYPDDTPPE